MKKYFKKIIIALVVMCCAISLVGCGGGNNKFASILTFNNIAVNEVGAQLKELTLNDAITYLTNAKDAQNPTMPNLQTGLKIVQRSLNSTQSGSYTVKHFAMLIREVEGVIIAEGKFDMIVASQEASVKFYHDGTYLGLEIAQKGYATDKQKKVLPLSSLGNYFGDSEFLTKVLSATPNYTYQEVYQIISNPNFATVVELENNEGHNPLVSAINEKQGYTAIQINVQRNSMLELGFEDSLNYKIAFDNEYNLVGFDTNITVGNEQTFGFEKVSYTGDIEMPSDFDDWTIRG